MKRIIILILFVFAVSSSLSAQPTARQKTIHMAAVRIAEIISVPELSKDAFIALYQSYKKESGEIMKSAPESGGTPDEMAEAKILSDFEKSEKILALRKKYYFKFRTVISASQIQKMYDAERAVSVRTSSK